jgi:hypothetical protein
MKMKNILSKTYITLFFLLVSISTFANPGESSDGVGLEDADAPPASIDDYIVLMVFAAILFALIRFKSLNRNQVK